MPRIAKIHDLLLDVPQGTFALVDRLWPRGISKADFGPDLWAKGAAPSTSLRKWFHSGGDFSTFTDRYRAELDAALADGDPDLISLLDLVRAGDVTLVYASKDRDRNHAQVLAQWLEERVE
ncbi:hypothetical protein CKALI_08840 [Corynebacterium kalinowskii]|uniref:DUF488 domain-containing protein n=1 Tax=Corynebacterium kalinowskii TaxID=2675216 RepID=A0A6B8VMH5_9CORY|nr:DUF488 family protein [Corynebacterium kalinowskii]QGU02624.1 hypothetical protein CKALI_08840 [Corynebacterium kalinowskii]